MLKYAQMGSTWEIVVILVDVPTKSPTCEFELPATPSIGAYTFVHSRFSSALAWFAFAAAT